MNPSSHLWDRHLLLTHTNKHITPDLHHTWPSSHLVSYGWHKCRAIRRWRWSTGPPTSWWQTWPHNTRWHRPETPTCCSTWSSVSILPNEKKSWGIILKRDYTRSGYINTALLLAEYHYRESGSKPTIVSLCQESANYTVWLGYVTLRDTTNSWQPKVFLCESGLHQTPGASHELHESHRASQSSY